MADTKDKVKMDKVDGIFDDPDTPATPAHVISKPPKQEVKPLPDVDLSKAITPDEDVVEFRARYAEFSMCMTPPETVSVDGRVRNVKHGHFVNFNDFMFITRDKDEIKFLRDFMKSERMGSDIVFELPKLDPLALGNMFNNIESMTIHELRASCKAREINFQDADDESQLRYLLVKNLSRSDAENKKEREQNRA